MSNTQSVGGAVELKPTGKMYLGTDLNNITSGIVTLVPLDTIPAGFVDGIEDTVNNKIVIAETGLYLVCGGARWNAIVADQGYNLYVKKNGTIIVVDYRIPATVLSIANSVVGIVRLVASDELQMYVYHNAGVDTVDVMAGVEKTWMAVQRLR